jgi:hypothetical protein
VLLGGRRKPPSLRNAQRTFRACDRLDADDILEILFAAGRSASDGPDLIP